MQDAARSLGQPQATAHRQECHCGVRQSELGECTALIHARFHELSEREEAFTATDVRDAYQGQIHRHALLLESFGEYLTQTKERIGIDRALKTFKLRTYQLSLLREYLAEEAQGK